MSKSACRPIVGSRALRPLAIALLSLASFLAPTGVLAQAGEFVRPDAPDSYTVAEGDTLWDIAYTFLSEPWRWPDIWRVNPDIADPHLIYPGDVIRLRYVDGQPVLELERGLAGRTTRLTPEDTIRLEPRVRATPLLSAIPTIDLEAVSPFLRGNRVVDQTTYESAGYVIQGESGRILVGAGDRFYARGAAFSVGDGLSIVRSGGRYIDPDTGEDLGFEAQEIGTAQVQSVDGDIATLLVNTSREDIRLGDRLLPIEERAVSSTFYPSAPDASVDGRMIAVLDGVTQIGQFSAVALDVGSREGIEVGHVLGIERQGPLVRDRMAGDVVRMPSTRAGLLMVFRVFDRVSYGVVLQSQVPLAVLDEVTNP
jgi:hypothetical protein